MLSRGPELVEGARDPYILHMKSRTEQEGAILSPEEFQAFKAQGVVSSIRVSHYPQVSWYKLGEPLGQTEVASVFKSAARVVELPDQQAMYKSSKHTLFAIKIKEFAGGELTLARRIYDAHRVSMCIPYAKIKPPVMYKDGEDILMSVVMAELKGQTLASFLFEDADYRQQRQLTISAIETLQIMREVAWSLLWDFHTNNLIHRDISPANVMLDCSVSPPKVRIYDVDYVKQVGAVTFEGAGTPLFMPLESLNSQPTSQAADVFGLGWIFYLLLRGKMPAFKNLDDVRLFVRNVQFNGLFNGLEDQLDLSDRSSLHALLSKTFDQRQYRRGTVLAALDTIENILLKLELKSKSAEESTKINRSNALARQLRDDLVFVACSTSIGDAPSVDVVNSVNSILTKLSLGPHDLPLFLSILRVDILMGETSISAIQDKVRNLVNKFEADYIELKQLQREVANLGPVLSASPLGQHANQLYELSESINYLLWHYGRYSWSLDNLASIDRKLAKMLMRARPIVEVARIESAQIEEAAKVRTVAAQEWQQFWAQGRDERLKQQAQHQISDRKDPLTGKRKAI